MVEPTRGFKRFITLNKHSCQEVGLGEGEQGSVKKAYKTLSCKRKNCKFSCCVMCFEESKSERRKRYQDSRPKNSYLKTKVISCKAKKKGTNPITKDNCKKEDKARCCGSVGWRIEVWDCSETGWKEDIGDGGLDDQSNH
jgi:hypothetical protein